MTVDFDPSTTAQLAAADVAVEGDTITLHRPGGDVACAYADDGTWFAGRDRAGQLVRGVRMSTTAEVPGRPDR